MVALRLSPLSVAVMRAFELNPLEDAVKVPITLPDATTVLDGTVRPAVRDIREMVVFTIVEWSSVMVHVVEEFAVTVEGLQFSVFICTPATGG